MKPRWQKVFAAYVMVSVPRSPAMTLVESRHPRHQALSTQLLDAIMPFCGNALRLGVTGTPGAGKSTFLEAFGMLLIREGLKVAVIAVDPSSPVTGGSILGDKTRMNDRRVPRRRLFARYPPPAIWAVPVSERGN
ncbi:hypothetical protein ECZU51_48030 [Escherichia coli]|nr:hypothetical protein ECZU51_48030 [Escherichia coli]